MKKSELKQLIKEELQNILLESKTRYRGKFSVRKGSGNSAKDWKKYIEKISGIEKISIYPSAYVNHPAIDIIVNNKQAISKIIKSWRNYGINWPEASDFVQISDYTALN